MIEIGFLTDYPETIPALSQWFRAQWPAYYAGRSPADVAEDFYAEAKGEGLPVRLVAFVDGELAGTIVLRKHATNALPAYHPGLGGLLVVEGHRGLGIGSELVRAGMDMAREQGYERVYTATAAARGILERLGWEPVEAVWEGNGQVMVYRYEFEERTRQ